MLTPDELLVHLQSAQLPHLQLQIAAITQLQRQHIELQQQLQTVNAQQVHLTTLITKFESKLEELDSNEIHSPNHSVHSSQPKKQICHQSMSVVPSQQNLQFNINMDSHQRALIQPQDDHQTFQRDRWRQDSLSQNPIIQTIADIQSEIIQSQTAENMDRDLHKLARQYTLSQLPALYQSINRKTNYLPTLHHKLMVIGGSKSTEKLHHITAIDLMAKTTYKMLSDDPILEYVSWDTSYMALGVASKVNPARFAPSIRNERERMLFALKYGVSTNPNLDGLNQLNLEAKAPKHVLTVQRDDYLNRKIKEHPKVSPFQRSCSIMIRCGGCIQSEGAVGPSNGAGTTNRVDALNINTGDWITSLPSLKTRRYGASAVYSEKHGMFVIGGKDDQKELSVVEQWDIPRGEREWRCLPRMSMSRYSPSCGIYSHRGSEWIVVAGGYAQKHVLKSCELYNVKKRQWTPIKDLNVKRYAAGCAVWKRAQSAPSIVVGGGFNSAACKSVEEYDVHKQQWYRLPDTNAEHRCNPSLWVGKEYGRLFSPFCGLLCIAGNKWEIERRGCIEGTIEFYDPREWRQQWFIAEHLSHILRNNDVNAVVRGMIPFR